MKQALKEYVKYNMLVGAITFGLYVPYNLFFLHYSLGQTVRWIGTAPFLFLFANAIIQPVVRYFYKRGWLKR